MIDPLSFTIGLAVILLSGGIFIGKSTLPDNQKLASLLLIMALFALVSIVNEVKKKPVPGRKPLPLEIVDITKRFYLHPETHRHIHRQFHHDIPHIEDPIELVNTTLAQLDPSRPDTFHLSFLYSENKPEMATAFKEYTHLLYKHKAPALYLDLTSADYSIRDFKNALKVPNLESIDETVKKFNKAEKYPVIFVNNADNAFTFDETHSNSFVCSLCEYLVQLFDNHKVHIIFSSNDILTRDYLKADPYYSSRFNFIETTVPTDARITDYLLNHINHNITEEEKKFNAGNIGLLTNKIGWNPLFIGEYLNNIEEYTGVEDYVNKRLESEATRVAGFTDFADLISTLLSLTEESRINSWINYSTIRKEYVGNPTKKLQGLRESKILVAEDSSYRFSNITIYNALMSKRNQVF